MIASTDRGYADLDDTTAPPAALPMLAHARAQFGGVPRAVARMAHAPALFAAFRTAVEAFEATSLTPVEREVLVLVYARDVGCATCIGIHRAIAARLGARDVAEAILAGPGAVPADARLAALARFAGAAHRAHGDVDAATWDGFLAAGFTRAQALEVMIGLGAYTMSTFANRLIGA